MATLRLMSGFIEMMAGLLMLKVNDLEKALTINALLALVGPTVLMTTMAIGLIGLMDRISYSKIIWIVAGVMPRASMTGTGMVTSCIPATFSSPPEMTQQSQSIA